MSCPFVLGEKSRICRHSGLEPESSFSSRADGFRLKAGMTKDSDATSRVKSSHSCKGFTLIELIVVIIIIVVMMGLFLNRVTFYQEQAEKTAMEMVAGAIQSSLTMQYGQIMTRGKPSDVAALAQDNPINWLQKMPKNYSGEFYDPTPRSVESGRWMFDLRSRELIYVPPNTY